MSYMSERSPSGQWPSGHPLDPRGSTTIVYRGSKTTDSDVYRVGVYGWRKRCLYFMIILLSVVIIVNMALTVWIMRVLDFSLDGIGGLEIVDDGIKVRGRAEFEKPVHFNNLATAKGVPLSLESDRGINMNARNKTGHVTSRLTLGENGTLQAQCDRFEIRNNKRELLFFTDKNEVAVKVENLRIIGEGGSKFDGAIQTETIRPEPDKTLRLESPTRGLEVNAAQDIELLSRAGDIVANSLHDIKLEATDGILHLHAKNMFILGNRKEEIYDMENTSEQIYDEQQLQLCLCGTSGRVFLSKADRGCRATSAFCNQKNMS